MKFEFFDDKKEVFFDTNDEEIKIISNGKIENFQFNSGYREIKFQVEKDNQIVLAEIPTSLLLYPFDVYLTEDTDLILDQIDKIENSEFFQDLESAKIFFRPDNTGNIFIIGSTQEEHEKMVMKIGERQVEKEVDDLQEKNIEKNEVETVNPFETWENEKKQNNQDQDNTIIYIILGIIIVVIIGIIVKIKKN